MSRESRNMSKNGKIRFFDGKETKQTEEEAVS